MEGRFQLLKQKDIDSLSEKAKNDNTSKSMKTWINQFESWAEWKKKDKDLCSYDPAELNKTLSILC